MTYLKIITSKTVPEYLKGALSEFGMPVPEGLDPMDIMFDFEEILIFDSNGQTIEHFSSL